MYTVWKYEIEPDFVNQIINMPKDATIISFGVDAHNKLCFWALVDAEAPREEHVVACVGTGWSIDHVICAKDRYAHFVGTAAHGRYVWHLFDLGAVPVKERWELVETDGANGRVVDSSGAQEKNSEIAE